MCKNQHLKELGNAILSPFVQFSVDFRCAEESKNRVFSSAARRQGARWEGQSKRQKRWCFYGYKSKVETPSISVENYWSPSYSHSNKMEQEKVIFKIRTDWPVLLGRRRMPFNTLLTKENRSSCLILQIRGRYFWYFQPFFFLKKTISLNIFTTLKIFIAQFAAFGAPGANYFHHKTFFLQRIFQFSFSSRYFSVFLSFSRT